MGRGVYRGGEDVLKLFQWLFGSSRSQPLPSPEAELSAARRARHDAYMAVRSAESRRDDRDLGRARMVLQEATTRELQAGRVTA
jgi:hypothetical protein